MAALTGNAINASYQGLLKTTDNAAVGAVAKAITDGSGNAINLSIGTSDINFTGGNVDFSAATVTGLPAGGGGLVSGTGLDSLESALTTVPGDAIGNYSIAIGDEALVAIGATNGIAIGKYALVSASDGIKLGYTLPTGSGVGQQSVAIGRNRAPFSNAVSIGYDASSESSDCVVVGTSGSRAWNRSTTIGPSAGANASFGVSELIQIGYNASCSGNQSIAIGGNATATAAGAIALGNSVTAATANYTTTQNLQLTNYASLNFADDTAAAAGGVPLGGIYHTSGALKIRIS